MLSNDLESISVFKIFEQNTPFIIHHNGDDINIGGPSDWKLTVLMSGEFYRVITKWYEEKLKY